MDLEETEREDVDWIHAVQVAGSCEHDNESLDAIKDGNFLTSWPTASFSRRTLPHGIH
jgi:hypothetical protein